jgi:hypothetical protein
VFGRSNYLRDRGEVMAKHIYQVCTIQNVEIDDFDLLGSDNDPLTLAMIKAYAGVGQTIYVSAEEIGFP